MLEAGCYALRARDAGGYAPCGVLCMLEAVESEHCLLEMLEAMRCVLLCTLEDVEAVEAMLLCATTYAGGRGRCALFAGGVGGAGSDMLCATLYLEAAEGGFCLLEALEAPEVMRCMLPCMLEVAEGGLCLLEVLEVPEVPEVMCCMLLCML